MSVDINKEKIIVFKLLKLLHREAIAEMIFNQIYNSGISILDASFTNNLNQSMISSNNSSLFPELFPIGSEAPLEKIPLTIKVENLVKSHYSKIPFPRFRITLVHRIESNNQNFNLPDFKIRISVWNRWVDVSQEVLIHQNLVRSISNGRLEIDDFIIHDVSLKHGGYFIIHIKPVDAEQQVGYSINPWHSHEIITNSERTWAKRKRSNNKPESSSSRNSTTKLTTYQQQQLEIEQQQQHMQHMQLKDQEDITQEQQEQQEQEQEQEQQLQQQDINLSYPLETMELQEVLTKALENDPSGDIF